MKMIAAQLRADLLVTSEDGAPQLVIEVNNGRDIGTSLPAATHAQYKAMGAVGFLLLVTPRRFWLWSPAAEAPTYEGDTSTLLERYIHLDKVPLATLDGRGFSSVVYSWLGSIIFKPAEVLLTIPGQEWLVETGLHPHIYRGYIHWEAAG